MAQTSTYGYTNGSQTQAVAINMPKISVTKDFKEIKKGESDPGHRKYSNLTSPTNQPEIITVKANPSNSISSNAKRAFPSVSQKGYALSVTDDRILRVTQGDGIINDELVTAQLSFRATDGAYANGGVINGAAICDSFMRLFAFIFTVKTEGGQVTLDPSQAFLDALMHLNTELQDTGVSAN